MNQIDPVSILRIATLAPSVREEVTARLQELADKNIYVRITEALRPHPTQAAYFAQGRQPLLAVNGLRKIAGLPPIADDAHNVKITNSQPGLSFHQYGSAIDFCLLTNGGKSVSFDQHLDCNHDSFSDFQEIVDTFTKAGWISGVSWSDNDHLEKHVGGYNILQLKAMHDAGKLSPEGYVILPPTPTA